MQDTIIKGTGSSRTLASVPNFLTLYPTYEDFARALIDKTLPIDLGPLNPAGVQTMGTLLNKGNLLKDATAALYGLGAAAVPDEALAKAGALIKTVSGSLAGKAWFAHGTYIGSSSNGTTAKTLNCSFFPSLVLVMISRGAEDVNGASWSLTGAARDSVSGFFMGWSQASTSRYVSGTIASFVWGDNSVVVPGSVNITNYKYSYFIWG